MQLTIDILDGTYRVHSQTADTSQLIVNGDGETVISNGMTFRKDQNGFIWESAFSIVDTDHVEMVSTIDPSHGARDAFVIDEKGNPTKGMVTYKTLLRATNEYGRLTLRGDIHHGGGTTAVTMTKIA